MRSKQLLVAGGAIGLLGAIVVAVMLMALVADRLSAPWSVVAILGGLMLAAGTGLVLAVVLRKARWWMRAVMGALDDVSETVNEIRFPSGAGPRRILLARGPQPDLTPLIDEARRDATVSTLVVTDVAELVAELSGSVAVEFLPAPATDDELDVIGFTASRLVELAGEFGAQALEEWADGAVTRRWALSPNGVSAVASGAVGPTRRGRASGVVAQQANFTKDLKAATKAIDVKLDRNERALRRSVDDVYSQVESLTTLYRVLEPAASLPPMRGWALSPDLGLHLVRSILNGSVRTVLETGSGSSTVLMAMALDKVGEGRVVALEHDAGYAESTRRLIREHGVAHRATVIDAPLVDIEIDGEAFRWYSIEGCELPNDIDLLFVDGPPEATGHHARYPAVPLLLSALAPGARVLLDDGDRSGEAEIAQRWAELPGVSQPTTLRVERAAIELIVERGDDTLARSAEPRH